MASIIPPEILFDQFAQQYQEKYMEVDLYKDSFDLFCNAIKDQHADILEIGCGPGNVSRYLLNKSPNFNILGIDFAPQMIALAQKNVIDANFRVLDCRKMLELNRTFDAIMCAFCLPYLSMEESATLIQNCASLLTDDGILYISTMADYYENSGPKAPSSGGADQLYTYYHQADYLTEFLHQNDFVLLDLQDQAYPVDDGEDTVDLIIIAKKNLIQE